MVEEEAMEVGETQSEVKRTGIERICRSILQMPYAPKGATGINYY
jgi:hypothetical protein